MRLLTKVLSEPLPSWSQVWVFDRLLDRVVKSLVFRGEFKGRAMPRSFLIGHFLEESVVVVLVRNLIK